MSQADITPREALTRLGASSAEAIAQVLESFTPGSVERGEVSVLAEGTTPFANVPRGAVATSVSYIDGVTGANIFVLTPNGARNLAGETSLAQFMAELAASDLVISNDSGAMHLASALGVRTCQRLSLGCSAG